MVSVEEHRSAFKRVKVRSKLLQGFYNGEDFLFGGGISRLGGSESAAPICDGPFYRFIIICSLSEYGTYTSDARWMQLARLLMPSPISVLHVESSAPGY